MGIEIAYLAVQCVAYPILATYIDIWSTTPSVVRFFSRKKAIREIEVAEEDEIDEDVTAEAERVLSGGANNDTIVMNELEKQYPNGKIAVDGVSVGIPGGQCFGLLGINGAGEQTLTIIIGVSYKHSHLHNFFTSFYQLQGKQQ